MCLPVKPAASLMDFMNERREFLPSGCFLNQSCDVGEGIAAK